MTTTPNPAQCYDETGRPIDTGQRCAETPAGPSAPVTICEDGTPCPSTAVEPTSTTTASAVEAPRELPTTGVGLALVLFGAVLVRAVRRPA